jgi:predicted membrane protein
VDRGRNHLGTRMTVLCVRLTSIVIPLGRPYPIEQVANRVNDIFVGPLIAAATE